jgi:phosphoribosylformimino-5-aminoimidazole carboxamide ribotide isomerase
MRYWGVLDLQHGQVVRGIAGRRSAYRPVRSLLTDRAEPAAVALAFRAHFGLTHLYVADLDAIGGSPPALGAIAELTSLGFTLAVDAGLRVPADAEPLLAAGATTVVAGLETLAGPDALRDLVRRVGGGRVLLSLDLRDGRPVTAPGSAWAAAEPLEITRQAVSAGVRRLLVLDLARVGVGEGTGTEALCARLAEDHPGTEIVAGGGVRGRDDLVRLRECGVQGVLLASSLHDRRLEREDLV